MHRLSQKYTSEILPALQKKFGLKNALAAPRLKKIVVNIGVSDPQDPKQRKAAIDNIVAQFRVMTGQHPQITTARKSIAGFKLRQGDPLGVMVTLRGLRMWEFLDKLVTIVTPRIKDFRGVSRTAFDQAGNYNLGISEQIVFPEIEYDTIERVRGLQITFVTSTASRDHSFALLEAFGMPFAKEETTK